MYILYYTASPSERVGLVSILWQKAGRSIYNQSPKYSGSPSFYHLPFPCLQNRSQKHKGWRMKRYTLYNIQSPAMKIGHSQKLKSCFRMTIDDGVILKEIKCQFDYRCKYTLYPSCSFPKLLQNPQQSSGKKFLQK